MFRKFLLGALFFGALALIVAAVALPTRAAHSPSGTAQVDPPEPQAPRQADAFPIFEAVLSGANEVPSISTAATGRAIIVLDDDLSTVYYRVLVSDISNVTAAHIHKGQPDENGDIIFTLFDGTGTFGPGNPVSGTLVLTPTQVTELLVGNYYVNVHTTAYPGGQIRGQLGLHTPASSFNALLTGAEEVPPVTTPASGAATFSLNAARDMLQYEIEVSDIISITAAHLHTGWPGQEGPPVVPLYSGTGTFDPNNPLTGTTPINPQNLLDLITGYLYANIHTQAYPDGEIRGQVTSGYHAFEADLSGNNEVPPVTTNATGRAVMALDSDLNTLYYRVVVSDIANISAAHIYLGQPGEVGTQAFTLYSGGGTFDEDNPISGSIILTGTEQANNLIAGNYYVNILTTANPQGEIRGQLEKFTPEDDYAADLSGQQEVPPVNTIAYGRAEFDLNPGLDSLKYVVRVWNISNITAAHLHPGAPGETGPPVVPLYSGAGQFDTEHPLRGTASLSAQNVVDLLTGHLYINVHTATYPNGEIRGQLTPVTGWVLYFPMIFYP